MVDQQTEQEQADEYPALSYSCSCCRKPYLQCCLNWSSCNKKLRLQRQLLGNQLTACA
jgi:hypothetical protein